MKDPLSILAAAACGFPILLRNLLSSFADDGSSPVNVLSVKGDSPLILASFGGHQRCIEVLLEYNANTEQKNSDGKNALALASFVGHKDCVLLLLEKGRLVNIDEKDNYGKTSLIWASQMGNESCVRLLLEKGAQADAKDEGCQTALMTASLAGKVDCVRLLLEIGEVDPNEKDDSGYGALIYADQGEHDEVAKLLLEKGADGSLIGM